MKRKVSLIFGLILLFSFVGLVIFDFVLHDSLSDYLEVILKILEILFASAATLSITIGISLSIKKSIVNNKVVGSNNNEITQNNINGQMIIDNSTHNDPVAVVEAVNKFIIPFQQENIEKVVNKSLKELKKEMVITSPSKDFLIKFISESSTISNEDIREIWVNLLVQESKKQGSVSKRTLDIVKNLSSDEAKLFQEVAKYALSDGTIHQQQIMHIPFLSLSKLQDIGLLKSNSFITTTFTISIDSPAKIVEDGIIVSLQTTSLTQKKLDFSCEVLTSEGVELKNALGIEMKEKDIIFLGKILKQTNSNKNVSIYAYRINYIDGNIINCQEEDLLL